MAKPPWFKFYSADWLSSSRVRSLTLEEKGLFIQLLAVSWQEEPAGTIPADMREISRISGEDPRKISRIFAGSFGDLWEKSGDRRINRKLYDLAQAMEKARERQSAAGKKGANARWGSHSNPDIRYQKSDTDKTLNTIDQIPPPKKDPQRKKRTSSPQSYPQAFELFWECYPRKVGKGKAHSEWKKAIRSGVTNETLMNAVNAHIPYWQDPQYIPHASTWLYQRRWEDDPSHSTRNGRYKSITDENLEELERARQDFAE